MYKLIKVSNITETIRKALKKLVNILLFNPLGFLFIISLEAPSNASVIEGKVSATKSIYNTCIADIIILPVNIPNNIIAISVKLLDKLYSILVITLS